MLAATGHLAGDERHGPAGGRGAEVGGAGSDDQWAHDRAPPTGGRDRPTGWDEMTHQGCTSIRGVPECRDKETRR